MNMLSYLLISYFQKYEFGSRNDVLNSFSMLPPINIKFCCFCIKSTQRIFQLLISWYWQL